MIGKPSIQGTTPRWLLLTKVSTSSPAPALALAPVHATLSTLCVGTVMHEHTTFGHPLASLLGVPQVVDPVTSRESATSVVLAINSIQEEYIGLGREWPYHQVIAKKALRDSFVSRSTPPA